MIHQNLLNRRLEYTPVWSSTINSQIYWAGRCFIVCVSSLFFQFWLARLENVLGNPQKALKIQRHNFWHSRWNGFTSRSPQRKQILRTIRFVATSWISKAKSPLYIVRIDTALRNLSSFFTTLQVFQEFYSSFPLLEGLFHKEGFSSYSTQKMTRTTVDFLSFQRHKV